MTVLDLKKLLREHHRGIVTAATLCDSTSAYVTITLNDSPRLLEICSGSLKTFDKFPPGTAVIVSFVMDDEKAVRDICEAFPDSLVVSTKVGSFGVSGFPSPVIAPTYRKVPSTAWVELKLPDDRKPVEAWCHGYSYFRELGFGSESLYDAVSSSASDAPPSDMMRGVSIILSQDSGSTFPTL